MCSRTRSWLAGSGLLLAVGCGEGDGEPLNPNATIGGPSPVAQPTLAPTTPSTAPVQPTTSTPAAGTSSPVTPAGNGSLSPLGSGVMGNSGTSTDRWQKADVTRDGHNYYFMANGWGPGFASQSVEWNGTAFTVVDMEGEQGPNWQPASYPTVFCGVYSETSKACGLPAEITTLSSLRTGWRWAPNGNDGEYNAAYDVWLGTGPAESDHSGYLMVWLREPPGQQPAGSRTERDVTVANVEGLWDIWAGEVNNLPIVNWVRKEDADSHELEFDVLDFIRDAQARGIEVPGSHILSVAVGFEIWNGPVQNLESIDFYVDPQPL